MKAPSLIVATATLTFLVAPAIAQTPQQNARDSQGMANSQKQSGGQKRDRRVNKMIFRNANNRMHSRRAKSTTQPKQE